jgi:hypothetical protein
MPVPRRLLGGHHHLLMALIPAKIPPHATTSTMTKPAIIQRRSKQHAVVDLVLDRVVVVEPRLFARRAWRLEEMQLLALDRRSLLGDPERVMVEQADASIM